jgi:hypothetical protein
MHIRKVIAGIAILVFPIFALIVSTSSYFTYCYDFAGKRLPTADGITNSYGFPVCDNFLLGAPYLLFLLPLWIGGTWLLVFGLTGRSLTTAKEPESRTPMYIFRVIGGVAILLVSVPFVFTSLIQVMFFVDSLMILCVLWK